MSITLRGEIWEIQILEMMIIGKFEVNPGARLIRIEFTSQSYDFAERVADAVQAAMRHPLSLQAPKSEPK